MSGIGCAARLPYYMNTYGIHSIHGRAPAVATGVALARPDLHVWVIGGDGDMLSIGGNHLIHALRRNVNLKILMFNNQIYGLTKGQYSPTSEVGKVTKSTPFGSLDHPFNPISVALGAEATFVARTHDMDRKHMTEMFRRANEHQGAAFVEVYQNCNVFNDGAFDTILNKDARPDMLIDLKHGEPIRFGADREMGVVMNEFGEAKIVRVADVGEDTLLVHDETRPDPSLAFALSRLAEHPETPTPVGVFRAVDRPSYEVEMQRQLVGRGRAQRSRRPRQAAALRADLDGQLARARRGRSSSLRNTMPERGLGEKNVVFCGMRTRSIAAARVCATDTGLQRIAALGRALVDQGGDAAARRASSATSRPASRGHDERFDDRGVGGGDGRMLVGERARPRASACGIARARPRSSTRPSPCSSAMRRCERVDRRRASSRRSVDDVERVGEAGAEVDAGGQVEQAVDGLDAELVVDQLDDERHDRAGAADGLAGGAQLVAVGARGLEAVMTVGEHERRARRCGRGSRRCAPGRRSRRARGRRRRRRRSGRARCRARAAR